MDWVYKEASRSRAVAAAHDWHILLIGDNETGAPPVISSNSLAPSNCRAIYVEDLEIDSERVWRDVRALQAELWQNPNPAPDRHLHLATQWAISAFLFRLVYLEEIVNAVLEKINPDEVRVPPAWNSHVKIASDVRQLQWLVYATAKRRSVRCRRHWSSVIYYSCSAILTAGEQLARYALLFLRDLLDVALWLGAALSPRAPLLNIEPASESVENERESTDKGTIILSNADTDLGRQFDLERLSGGLARRCVAWILGLDRLIRCSDPDWQQKILPHYISGRNSDAELLIGDRFASARKASRRVFPVLLTPLLYRHRKVWFCSALTLRTPGNISERLRRLLSLRGMARERLLNWRRLVFAAKYFSSASHLFRALRPALLVTGNATDTHRALTLAARHCGVRSLATPHGIHMGGESFVDVYALADVHSQYGILDTVLSPATLPGAVVKRVVCHNMKPRPEYDSSAAAKMERGGARVLIVTGAFLNYDFYVRRSVFAKGLRALIERLAALNPAVEITIKSHPLSDHYELYDELQREFPAVVRAQWREPLKRSQLLPADVIVLYNYISTMFFSAVQQQIPVLASWGALTATGRRLIAVPELKGSDAGATLAGYIAEILSSANGAAAQEALGCARSVYDKFVEPPEAGLEEVMSLALGRNDTPFSLDNREKQYTALGL